MNGKEEDDDDAKLGDKAKLNKAGGAGGAEGQEEVKTRPAMAMFLMTVYLVMT